MMWCSRGCATHVTTGQLTVTLSILALFILYALVTGIRKQPGDSKAVYKERLKSAGKLVMLALFNVALIAWILK